MCDQLCPRNATKFFARIHFRFSQILSAKPLPLEYASTFNAQSKLSPPRFILFYNFENFETPPLKIHFDIYLFLGQSRNTSRVCGGRCPLDSQTQYFKCFSLKFKLNQDNIALFWSKTEASDSWGRSAMDEVRFCCYFQCHRGTANVCWFDHNISFPIVTVKISTIQYFKELQIKVYFKF